MEEKSEEKSYVMVEAFISKYVGAGGDKIVFADKRLRDMEIFRGEANKWRESKNNSFIEFLKIHHLSLEAQIAIAKYGPNAFSVIQIINF